MATKEINPAENWKRPDEASKVYIHVKNNLKIIHFS